MTDLFETIRERISAQDAAEQYGIEVRRGKARCIWHEDKHPSLSFKGAFCKCFSCGAGGSSIDVVMQLFGMDVKGAAAKLNTDFGLNLDMDKPADAVQLSVKQVKRLLQEFERKRWSKYCTILHAANERLTAYTGPESWDDPEFVRLLRIKAAAETELEHMQLMNASEWMELYRNEVVAIGIQDSGGTSTSRGALEGNARPETA